MTELTPTSPQEQRCLLRGTWQLASVFHFLNAFRSVLHLNLKFSMEELETALLAPNALLDDIHIGLLKAIPPISRNPLNQGTWISALCKKLKDWWHSVAEGPFPLIPQQGEELATYRNLTADVRAIILKALCEARLDQDDMRDFIGEMAKQEASFLCIRKERTGTDMQGATYWYENDPVAGQRLYKELQKSDRAKTKIRGQLVSPPATSEWETLATNLDEFRCVVDKLCSSKNKMEVGLGKKIDVDILPDLINAEKRKQRMLKKQLRLAGLLDNNISTEGVAISRSMRERKPVSYTFDAFDNSIDEALEVMREGCIQEAQKFTKTEPSDVTESDAEEFSASDSGGTEDSLQEKKIKPAGPSRKGTVDMEGIMGSNGEGRRITRRSQKRRKLDVMEESQESLEQAARGGGGGDGWGNNSESIVDSKGSEEEMESSGCSHKELSTIEEGDEG